MKKLFYFVIILILLAIVGGWLFKIAFIGQGSENENLVFEVLSGQAHKEISQNLAQQGIIENRLVFNLLIRIKDAQSHIIAGEHQLNPSWSMNKIINALISGSSISNEMNITVLEGWNLRDIGFYLENQGIAQAEELWEVTGLPAVDYDCNPDLPRPKNFSADYEFLQDKPANVSLEGYLFPDTYRIFNDAGVEEIVKKMLDNFHLKVNQNLLDDINSQNKTLYEILILASIIEKEGDTALNKKKVAGVYYNRLDIGMALQADPTVNYVTAKSTDRPSYDDIASDNPYNTYVNPGLPPGPICNPGIDSIMAAIYPDKNDYYYFINTPAGEMIFSRTFEEHKQNRVKYFED